VCLSVDTISPEPLEISSGNFHDIIIWSKMAGGVCGNDSASLHAVLDNSASEQMGGGSVGSQESCRR